MLLGDAAVAGMATGTTTARMASIQTTALRSGPLVGRAGHHGQRQRPDGHQHRSVTTNRRVHGAAALAPMLGGARSLAPRGLGQAPRGVNYSVSLIREQFIGAVAKA